MKKNCHSILCAVCAAALCPALSGAAFSDTDQVMPGIYEISGRSDDSLVLDIRTCTVQESADHSMQLYTPLNVNQQKFYLEALSGSFYRISTPATGEVLTADSPDDSSSGGGSDPVLSMEPLMCPDAQTADPSQTWRLKDAGYGYFYICSLNGKYLTIDGESPRKGSSVSLKDFDVSSKQKWKLIRTNFSAEDFADTDLVNPYESDGAYEHLRIRLKFGNHSEMLDASDFSLWMKETADHQLVLDKEALLSCISGLAERYDTVGQPISFLTSTGKELSISSGNFGWQLDVENTAASVLQACEHDGYTALDPVWISQGSISPGQNEIGDSYVEVDLTGQKVWLYQDGKLVLETDCVTGTYQTDRQTPDGVYSIYYRQSPAVLNGPGYSSPVEYWMAFYEGYGLHDANWRNSFGGEIYLTNGSHGCVNLPTEAARQIYEIAEIGFPVVCYN